ncbi:AAA family ATPase [Mucilaginibacter flavidus]|uniref:AAA family ATPase n=1 Tax=Mucilaginibacter flavidus TaxID=2949309 RepID=UPI002092291B|nr:ATP-binding protein [Mucilaginibacter flavidus]MCO5949848.1 ATP-binding protein [Mucilaginibacter flavidus]
MIIQFSVGNYGSFDEIQKLNFRATTLESCSPEVDQRNLISVGDQNYLKLIGIYGANASGKSNLMRSLSFFRELVAHSMASEELSQSGVNPFRQSDEGFMQPSYFQIVLLLEEKKYRYGFTLTGEGKIESEWLFGPAGKNETYYFKRSAAEVQINREWFTEAAELPLENLRDNALFLSFGSSYNGPVARAIRGYLANKITVDIKHRRGSRRSGVFGIINHPTNRLVEAGETELVLTWLKEVGLVYHGIELPEKERPGNAVILFKHIYDKEGRVTGLAGMDLSQDESDGTQKFYNYIGRLYRKFKDGGLYIVDEIDSNFHPALLQKIIRLFQNPEINTANAQLLFTSHDTNLMDPAIMRRDQFYFTEKTMYDATRLYSLADLKGIRNNADFARQYLAGLYGALPILGDYLEQRTEDAQDDA